MQSNAQWYNKYRHQILKYSLGGSEILGYVGTLHKEASHTKTWTASDRGERGGGYMNRTCTHPACDIPRVLINLADHNELFAKNRRADSCMQETGVENTVAPSGRGEGQAKRKQRTCTRQTSTCLTLACHLLRGHAGGEGFSACSEAQTTSLREWRCLPPVSSGETKRAIISPGGPL